MAAASEPLEQLIIKTQNVLQPLIAKPKLTDKLLSKPPFRFLHDIVTALMQSKGIAQGLFLPEELDTEAIKENKQAKTNFLSKIIDYAGHLQGSPVDCRSAKVLAGAEAENTNIWLLALAAGAADPTSDHEEAVKRVLAGILPGSVPAAKRGGSEAAPISEAKQAEPRADEDAKAREQKEREAQEKAERARAEEKKAQEERRAEPEKKQLPAASEAKPAAEAVPSKPQEEKKPQRPDSGGLDRTRMRDYLDQINSSNGEIAKTQDLLGKLITNPKLSEKLLSKPPFRFLQDIVTETAKATGFATNLYSPAEVEAANKDKDTKIAFLQKIISCVAIQLNVQIEAKPMKIVAGLEPEKTNKFLQYLSVAAISGDSTNAVNAVQAGALGPQSDKPPSRESVNQQEDPAKTSRPSSGASAAKVPEQAEAKSAKAAVEATSKAAESDAKAQAKDEPALQPASPRGDGVPSTGPSTSRKTARPTTARRRPPKLKENVREVDRPAAVEARVAAPTHIMKDGANSDSGGEHSDHESEGKKAEISNIDGERHGKLVRNILSESKKDDSKKKEEEDNQAKEGPGGIRMGKLKKTGSKLGATVSGAFNQEQLDSLRRSIQKICQATNPLGKCMDFVHDDVETMVKELQYWRSECTKNAVLVEKEQKATEDSLQPLQLQLSELDEQVKEQLAKINALKASISKNDARIQQLLRMVVQS